MIAPPANLSIRYVKTRDAARILGLSGRTLEKHRCYGTGPIYRKLGGRVVYSVEDLETWAALGTRQSTSDPGIGGIQPLRRPAPPTLQQTQS